MQAPKAGFTIRQEQKDPQREKLVLKSKLQAERPVSVSPVPRMHTKSDKSLSELCLLPPNLKSVGVGVRVGSGLALEFAYKSHQRHSVPSYYLPLDPQRQD